MRGPWQDSFEFKEFENFSKTIQTRSDPSGGGGFNCAARSPQGRAKRNVDGG